jgi:hypothetical protein
MIEMPRTGSGRGFVYCIDAALGIFIITCVLLAVVFFSSQAAGTNIGRLQADRLGKDVLCAMDKQGILESGNASLIEGALSDYLPSNMGMRLRIETYYYDSGGGAFNMINLTEYGEQVPAQQATYGARREFVKMRYGQIANYSIARAWIWQK